MELRHLRYFVAVAETLHFRRAAEVLHIAQPALSQQIRQLEEEIGAALFERSHHKVSLTQAGKAFCAKAQGILKDAKEAVNEARAVAMGNAGTIVIGFVSSAAIRILPDVLGNFREQMPRVEVELRELSPSEQIDCLHRSTIDLGFLHATLTDPAFESLVLAQERLIIALPKDSKYAKRSTVDLKDLRGEPAIMPARHSTPGYFERAQAAYEAAGIHAERVHHTRLIQTGLLLVGAGLGVSLVPESFRTMRVNGVAYRRLTMDPPPIELLGAWRRDNPSPLLARMVVHLRNL
ncbi:MAG TPA: LysR substrate-binding domain-containing protein [Bryobacteraceae bacterium]|jgi:DNA-binding transcriptional LysR family regulator|nr:LysR substrate-binding domain-containing protein [Bryobacteraceae bacterium]